MRNFLLGCCVGFMVGGIGATYALSGAQSTSPYSSRNLMGETNLYGAILGQQTDQWIQQQQLDNLREEQWQQHFAESLARRSYEQERAQAREDADWQRFFDEQACRANQPSRCRH